jgi:hypothetical protein
MQDYCVGENLLEPECYAFCRSGENDCRTALEDFCPGKIPAKTDPNYDIYNKTCACFQTGDFYDKWRDNNLQSLGSDAATVFTKIFDSGRPECNYPNCVSGSSIKPFGAPACPSNNIQVCFAQQTTTTGDATDTSINTPLFLNCVQTVSQKLIPDPTPTPPDPHHSIIPPITPSNTDSQTDTSSSLYIEIGVVILFILISWVVYIKYIK